AGLALKTHSSLVKGLIPLRALVAGLWTTLIFTRPGSANTPGPFLPTADSICSDRAAKTELTCLRARPVFAAIAARISLFESVLGPVAMCGSPWQSGSRLDSLVVRPTPAHRRHRVRRSDLRRATTGGRSTQLFSCPWRLAVSRLTRCSQ